MSSSASAMLPLFCAALLLSPANSFLARSTFRAPRLSTRMSAFATNAIPERLLSDRLLKQVNGWCGLHGLMYTDGHIAWTPAPLSLLPSPFPRSSFAYAKSIQRTWNKLVDRLSRDRAFLVGELRDVSAADEFTLRLLRLYESVPEEMLREAVQFGVLRSDYMVDRDGRALQVEINTISSSFGSLSQKVSLFHKYLLDRNAKDPELASLLGRVTSAHSAAELREAIEENRSLENIAASIAAAHRAYNRKDSVVLFVVQPGERNQGDQRALENQIWTAHGISCEFLTLDELSRAAQIVGEDRRLLVRSGASEFEISVVYFRAGYTPNDYPSENEWRARECIEGSAAIKCPSVGYHLAGTKAVQAALCKPGVLEKYLNAEECAELRSCFAMQFSLGDKDTLAVVREAVEAATQDGSAWVLKPQREGGGNNFYGNALSNFLKTHENESILSGYVLMQRIFPKLQQTVFYRQGKAEIAESISELGIYGTYLGYGDDEKDKNSSSTVNECAGYLLRTKASDTDEGGVATGYSVLNSVALYDI